VVGGLALCVVFDVVGELLARELHLPIPGAVVGMALLFAALVAMKRRARDLAARVESGASILLRHMSLFFVPAGVGVMVEIDVLRAEWLPLSIALVASTLLALAAGAGAFAAVARRRA
jgi:holin-like protein